MAGSGDVPFDEAIESFRRRVPMRKERWLKRQAEAKQRAFTVAGVASADVLTDVWLALDDSIARGATFEEFKALVAEKLTTEWAGTVANPGHRVETIFRTNALTAYSAGAYEQRNDPVVKRRRPYLQFRAVGDQRTTDICRELDGKVLPADDPFWASHTPPLHFQCFPTGTMVTAASGDVPIDGLVDGDWVLTHRGRYRRVSHVFRSPSPDRLLLLSLSGGREIAATANHPALTDRGWVPFSALRPGDRLFDVSERPAVNGVVRDRHDAQAVGDEGPDAVGWATVARMAQLDSEARTGEVEVSEVKILAENERALKREFSPRGVEPVRERLLGAGWLGARLGVCRWVCSVLSFTHLDALADRFRRRHPVALRKHGGSPSDSRMGLLGVAVRPMFAACRSLLLMATEYLSDRLASRWVVGPLGGHRLAAVADGDVVLFQEAPHSSASFESEFRHDRAEAHATVDVQLSQVGAKCIPVRGLQASRGRTPIERHTRQAVSTIEVVKVRSVGKRGPVVFDLTVEDDESYVAEGLIVHNCRSRIVPLTAEEAGDEGITEEAPDVQAAEGFGAVPKASEPWTPDLTRYPAPLREAIEARLKQA